MTVTAVVLGQAQPDESRFYQRFQSSELVTARRRLTGTITGTTNVTDENSPVRHRRSSFALQTNHVPPAERAV